MGEGLGTRSGLTEGTAAAMGVRRAVAPDSASGAVFSSLAIPTPEEPFNSSERFVLWLVNPLHKDSPGLPNFSGREPHWGEVGEILDRLRLFARVGALWGKAAPLTTELLARCNSECFATAAQNMRWQAEEARILTELQRGGVRAFPLKGISLARILHGTPSARTISDLDFAVPPADIAASAEILQALGFTPLLPLSLLRNRSFVQRTSVNTSELGCVRQDECGRTLVELHWKLFASDRGKAWPVHSYAEAGPHALPPTEYFFYLCARRASHGWADLSKLCDVGDFAVRFAGKLDAGKFRSLASENAAEVAVDITLEILEQAFGIAWERAARNPRARYAARQLVRRPFLRKWAVAPMTFHREQVFYADSKNDRLRYWLRLLRPTKEEWVMGTTLRAPWKAWGMRAGRLAGMALRTTAPLEPVQ